MAKRYEFPDEAWELIADLVSPEQKRGRPRSDDLLMLNGIFWMPMLSCRLALPSRAVRSLVDGVSRLRDWRDDGTSDRIVERLHARLNQERADRAGCWMIDSTAVYAVRVDSGARGQKSH